VCEKCVRSGVRVVRVCEREKEWEGGRQKTRDYVRI